MVLGVLIDVSLANKFSSDDLPFRAPVFLANIVGGESVVSPFDAFFVSAAE